MRVLGNRHGAVVFIPFHAALVQRPLVGPHARGGQGAMDKVVAYIDGLNLSREQKNALFLCFYSQKSLGKIRWSN